MTQKKKATRAKAVRGVERTACDQCGTKVFVCAHCNGIVTGADADAIQREMREGTPNTPDRIAMIQRATEVYRRSLANPASPIGRPQ